MQKTVTYNGQKYFIGADIGSRAISIKREIKSEDTLRQMLYMTEFKEILHKFTTSNVCPGNCQGCLLNKYIDYDSSKMHLCDLMALIRSNI